MKYYSTNNKQELVSFEEAVRIGLPADNGLFMPESIPALSQEFLDNLEGMTLAEIGYEIASRFVEGSIPKSELQDLVHECLNF